MLNSDSENTSPQIESRQKKYHAENNSKLAIDVIECEDPLGSQLSYIKPKKRQQTKQPSREITKRQIPETDTNIDNVGEAAEWLEKGTNQDEEFEKCQAQQVNMKNSSVRERMQEKAQRLMNGTFRHKASTTMSLLEKARQLREDNERKRPQGSQNPKNLQSQRRKQSQQSTLTNILPSPQPLNKRQEVQPAPQSSSDDDEQSKWDQINQQTLTTHQQAQASKKTTYSYFELQSYYLQRDLTQQKKTVQLQLEQIQKDSKKGVLSLFTGCFCQQKRVKGGDMKIRLQLLSLSRKQIQSDQDVYLLQHFWKQFKTTPFNRYSSEWPDLGFQGRDPATDLRSTGVLSLLMMYDYAQKHPEQFMKVYASSTDCAFEFPMAISYIKIAGTFVKLIKKDKLTASDFESFCEWYRAICHYTFHQLLKDGGKHITQFGMAITKILEDVESSPTIVTKTYKKTK